MSGPSTVREVTEEPLGRRIGRLRTAKGWTQQDLADRMAMSRTAISHLEASISQPSERSVILLAGLFHLEPRVLVEGSSYPESKAERLPATAPRYTEIDLQLSVLASERTLWSLLDAKQQKLRREHWIELISKLIDLSDDQLINEKMRSAVRDLRTG